MEPLPMVFFSVLLFHSSDAGTFTWLHSDDTVNFVEGETAKLNWSVRIGAGKTWLSVKITRSITVGAGPGDVDLIRRKPSGVEIFLAERGADMDLEVQVNTNVLNVTFTLGNLSRKTDEMYYRITVYDDDPDSSVRNTKLNVDVPSSCTIQPNATTVNETDIISLSVNTTGNPPVNNYIWSHPNGSSPTGITDRWTFPASRHDTGIYKVSVYNGIGDRGYCTSNVTVQFPSSCKLHSNATTIKETEIVELNFTSTGNPPVNNYTWTHPNGSRLTWNTDRRTFPASRHDTGTYRVSVYNSVFGWRYCTRNISVQFSPTITDYSCKGCEMGSAVENQNITLLCSATGNPSPNITWMKNGQPYSGSDSGSVSGNMVVFQNVTIDDKGNYTCIAENGVGKSDSKTLTLLVKYKPKNTTLFSSNDAICKDATITLSCTADAYPSVNNYSLFNGNIYIGSNTNGQFSITATLLGTNRLCCLAKNEIGEGQCAYFDIYVLGNVNATFKINNMSKKAATVIEGKRVVLQSDISGDESYYFFTWSKINDSLPSHVKNDTRQLTFASINRTDEGSYQVSLRDKRNCSSQTGFFHLTVNFNPESTSFSISPNQTGFCLGSLVTISCMSEAKPPANYTLYHNTQLIQDNGARGVFNVTLNDTGKNKYTCVPYNLAGFGQNQSFELLVKEPPKVDGCRVISNNTINGTVVEGERVTFSCIISGSEPLNTTWTNGSHVWHQVNLTFESVNRVNDGFYNVTVNNGKECKKAESESIRLVVYFPSSCKIKPDVIRINETESVSLKVSTTGNPPVNKYTWTHPNGSRLTWNTDRRTFPASRRDNGTFKVSIYNGVGNWGYCTSHLTVQYLPEMPNTFNASPSTVCQNGTVTLTCGNSDAFPPVYKYSLHDTNGFVGYSPSGSFKLQAKTVGQKIFWCFPWNAVGIGKNRSTNFTVVGPPDIVLYKNNTVPLPEPLELVEGKAANVTFTNSGNLQVTWQKLSGNQRNGQNFKDYTIYGLKFKPVHHNHSGMYGVTARDGNGCVTNKTFSLSVHFPPTLALITPSFSINKSENAIITCNAEGNPEPSLSWTSTTNKTLNTTSDGKILVLNSVEEEDGGIYTCTATNYLGKINSSSAVTIVYKPYAVWMSHSREAVLQGSEITINESQTVNLTCHSRASPLAEYYWIVQTNIIQKVNGKTLFIKKVRPEHAGTYKCTATNYLGSSSLEYKFIVNYSPENRTTCYHNPDEIQENTSVTLICEGMSFPNASVSWIPQKINGEPFQVYSNDSGKEFVCTACNSLGCGVCKIGLDVKYGPNGRMNCRNEIRVKEGSDGFWLCEASANPHPNYTVTHGDDVISNMSSGYLKNITRKSNGSYITCLVSNKINSATCETQLIVTHFSGFTCGETKILKPPANAVKKFTNITVEAYPEPTLVVKSTSEEVIDAEIKVVSVKMNYIRTYKVEISASSSPPYILYAKNGAGEASYKLTISNIGTVKHVDGSLTIKKKTMSDVSNVRPIMLELLEEAYGCHPDVIEYKIMKFMPGSLIMDFQLTLISDLEDYLQPLNATVTKKATGLEIINIKKGFHPRQIDPDMLPYIILGISVACVILLIIIIVLILRYWKRKRPIRKNSALVDENGSGEIPMHEPTGTRNDGYSSDYAVRGPSHIDPAYDSVDGVKKDAKDKNDNQAQPEKETEEPAYAAVDRTKKKKKHGELLYADLGDFQKNGDKPAGGRGGIVLEPLPKGKDTKMPDKYEETIYAEIVGTKKATSEDAVAASTGSPLGEELGQDAEADKEAKQAEPKPSDQTADSSKTNNQNTTTGENDNPPDSQPAKPPPKEESGKEESDSTESSETKLESFRPESSC